MVPVVASYIACLSSASFSNIFSNEAEKNCTFINFTSQRSYDEAFFTVKTGDDKIVETVPLLLGSIKSITTVLSVITQVVFSFLVIFNGSESLHIIGSLSIETASVLYIAHIIYVSPSDKVSPFSVENCISEPLGKSFLSCISS